MLARVTIHLAIIRMNKGQRYNLPHAVAFNDIDWIRIVLDTHGKKGT